MRQTWFSFQTPFLRVASTVAAWRVPVTTSASTAESPSCTSPVSFVTAGSVRATSTCPVSCAASRSTAATATSGTSSICTTWRTAEKALWVGEEPSRTSTQPPKNLTMSDVKAMPPVLWSEHQTVPPPWRLPAAFSARARCGGQQEKKLPGRLDRRRRRILRSECRSDCPTCLDHVPRRVGEAYQRCHHQRDA